MKILLANFRFCFRAKKMMMREMSMDMIGSKICSFLLKYIPTDKINNRKS